MNSSVGNLTYVGAVGPDLILARCGCGYPAVLVPQRMWTAKEVLGCARCHKEVAQFLAVKAQEEKEQKQYEKEQAAEKAERYEEFGKPHYEQLDDELKELFRTLNAGSIYWDARTVADLYRISPAEAFQDYIVPLLEANLLLEWPAGINGS